MAINKIDNLATINYDGAPINSNTVETLLLLPPTILKAVDLLTASIGNILTYTITITNVALSPLTNLPFSDKIPLGTNYITDSFKVNGAAATPTFNNDTLSYTIPSIAALGTAVLTFQVTITG